MKTSSFLVGAMKCFYFHFYFHANMKQRAKVVGAKMVINKSPLDHYRCYLLKQ
jgi:hypothetical protein